MSVTLTESAVDQIKKQLHKRGQGLGLRLGVKKSGCSGYAYVIDYADQAYEADIVFEDRGVKVLVDKEELSYLDGMELDFTREGLNEAFRFKNPNVEDMCGCGESFSVK